MPLKLLQDRKKVIAIAAGKGGVGKSTLTALLALQLKSAGYKVGVLDCDLYGPSLRKMLPEERMPGKRGGKFLPALSCGISIISLDHFSTISSSVRAPIANHWTKQLLQQVEWGPLDYLLIDFPPGTGDIPLTLCESGLLSSALIVTTPQQIATQDVKRAIELFRQTKVPLMGIVENMSYLEGHSHITPFGSGGGEALAKEYQIPLLEKLPLISELSLACDLGLPYYRDEKKPLWGQDTVIAKIMEKIVA